MDVVDKNIEAFKEIEIELKKDSINKWALLHKQKLIDVYESFEDAVGFATEHFEAGSYVIRQIGVDSVVLPISVVVNR